jgi:dGTPase
MEHLAPYASDPANTRGRRYRESDPKHRGEYQRDRDRIIHSTAFRRLEYKTQVFVNHEGDLYRTRLTHSIEVAQIGRSIARALQLNEDLTEAISLAHDLGHTPFGHAGQDALNECMKDHGGFEHNLQSLRVVDELEERYAEFNGLNLTFETREGILKHCSVKHARTLGDVGERFINRQQPALEAQLANLADSIAYNSHDVDDGLRSGLITIEQLVEVDIFREQYEEVLHLYPGVDSRRQIHEIIRRLINCQAVDLINQSLNNIGHHAPSCPDEVRGCETPLIDFSQEMAERNQQLKRFLRKNLYQHYRVLRMTSKAHRVLQSLFDAFFEEPQLLPGDACTHAQVKEQELGIAGKARVVADYIAGMTDRYAINEYDRLFDPRQLT